MSETNPDSTKSNNVDDNSAERAIDQFRQIHEKKSKELTEKEIAEIDRQCEIIKNRDIISQNVEHEATEIISWKFLGLHSKPIIIFNFKNYWKTLFEIYNNAKKLNFGNFTLYI